MTARDEILAVMPAVRARSGSDVFTPQDLIDELDRRGSPYAASTIRTHIVPPMCTDVPDHHSRVDDDLQQVGRDRYRARTS